MKPLTNKSGEVRELKRSDFKRIKPMAKVLPKDLQKVIRQR